MVGEPVVGGHADPVSRWAGLPAPVVLLVGLAAAVIVATGVRAVAWLVAPVALALVVVITVRPVHGWLHRRGLPRWAAGIVLVVLATWCSCCR